MKRKITALLFACCVTTLAAQSGQPQPPENYRPRIHFSPAKGWMSDPNGLVYYDDSRISDLTPAFAKRAGNLPAVLRASNSVCSATLNPT